MTAVGKLLRDLRGTSSIYLVEQESEVSHSIISKSERGKALPSTATLRRLGTHYKCTNEEMTQLVSALERDRIAAQCERLREGVMAIGMTNTV